jgi:hypothetical protein
MESPVSCRGILLAGGLALLLPFLVARCPDRRPPSAPPGGTLALSDPGGRAPDGARSAVCLERWVLLHSFGGCPVLASAEGYRLGLLCGPGSRSRGLVVFAGPFPGRAYVSDRPVPLGRWVHLAALVGTLGGGSRRAMLPSPAVVSATTLTPGATVPTVPIVATVATVAIVAIVSIDGVDVTAGRVLAGALPFPLGRDPWRRAPLAFRQPVPAAGPGLDAPLSAVDGRLGAWRLTHHWRTLAQVAAARGTPWRLGDLPANPVSAESAPYRRSPERPTVRGWLIIAGSLLLAGSMTAAGVALRTAARDAGGTVGSRRRDAMDLGVLRRETPLGHPRALPAASLAAPAALAPQRSGQSPAGERGA